MVWKAGDAISKTLRGMGKGFVDQSSWLKDKILLYYHNIFSKLNHIDGH